MANAISYGLQRSALDKYSTSVFAVLLLEEVDTVIPDYTEARNGKKKLLRVKTFYGKMQSGYLLRQKGK